MTNLLNLEYWSSLQTEVKGAPKKLIPALGWRALGTMVFGYEFWRHRRGIPRFIKMLFKEHLKENICKWHIQGKISSATSRVGLSISIVTQLHAESSGGDCQECIVHFLLVWYAIQWLLHDAPFSLWEPSQFIDWMLQLFRHQTWLKENYDEWLYGWKTG